MFLLPDIAHVYLDQDLDSVLGTFQVWGSGGGEGEQLWVEVVDHGPLAHTCPCGHW